MSGLYQASNSAAVGDFVYVTVTGNTFYKGQVLEYGRNHYYPDKKSYKVLVSRDESYKFVDIFDSVYQRADGNSELMHFLGDISILDKICDIARIVDPVGKKILRYQNGNKAVNKFRCFDFWSKDKACDNCISMRAYNDNQTYTKLEHCKDKMYMITAVPYEMDGRRVVIELLKEVTKSVFFASDESNTGETSEIHSLIDQMNSLVYKDPLTGLYNRRYINEKLPVDLLNCTLLSQDMTVIMVDIDNFKTINDCYGHDAGDKALRYFAQIASDSMPRGSDWTARFGGDEFLICMPGADLVFAKRKAEFLRKKLEDGMISYDGGNFRVTAGFGICTVKPDGREGLADILRRADEKLYQAKKNGKNRIVY